MSKTRSFIAGLAGLLVQAAYVCAQEVGEIDPATGEPVKRNILGYKPATAPAIASGIIYLLTAFAFIIWYRRHPGRYMLTIIIAVFCYVIGLFMRPAYAKKTDSLMLMIIMNLFTLLSPCGFIATVYMLLSRLSYHLSAEELLMIRPSRLTKLFVASDIITFFIQGGGGGIQAAKTESSASLGKKIVLIGLIAQMISFIIYTVVFLVFLYRVKTWRSVQWHTRPEGFFKHWLSLATMMLISCVGILVRSAFRTIENAQGFHGYLALHEGYFYVLDCLPLWIAVLVFVITWPPVYLTGYKMVDTGAQDGGVEMGRNRSTSKV
ncbi:RTA1-domain-containing protein [Ceratobasidium sp. AG-I]|nr:RTA1-domain-containing protein [Ceratobasidium sp. AG-I]